MTIIYESGYVMVISLKNVFRLTIISILLKRDLTSYNIYYDRVPILYTYKIFTVYFPRSL